MSTADIVCLDVGGVMYKVHRSTLAQHPNTMLARLVSDAWMGDVPPAEPIFIDRDGERFKYILDWFRYGAVVLPRRIPIDALRMDAAYFGLPEDALAATTKANADVASLAESLASECASSTINAICYSIVRACQRVGAHPRVRHREVQEHHLRGRQILVRPNHSAHSGRAWHRQNDQASAISDRDKRLCGS